MLFVITECSASAKLASPAAVPHSADIPGVSWDVSAELPGSQLSLLSAQEQLHTAEEKSSASE